jgi:hypothetical protein
MTEKGLKINVQKIIVKDKPLETSILLYRRH